MSTTALESFNNGNAYGFAFTADSSIGNNDGAVNLSEISALEQSFVKLLELNGGAMSKAEVSARDLGTNQTAVLWSADSAGDNDGIITTAEVKALAAAATNGVNTYGTDGSIQLSPNKIEYNYPPNPIGG